jgi:hypothetical protein
MEEVLFEMSGRALLKRSAVCLWASLLLIAAPAWGAPEAHILRIDPRAAQENGNPILTTVLEVVESKRVSDTLAPCAEQRGNAQFDCMSEALEKPLALYTPFPFPSQNAVFTVKVDGTDNPAKFVSDVKWGDSLQQPGVGTAWLILVDADRRMGGSFQDAKQVADRFVASMGPSDIVDVIFFDDRGIVRDSKWLPAPQRAKASAVIAGLTGTFASRGRNRSLLTIIKTAATDGFKALGNVGEDVKVPLHQAMVVLSDGFGGADPSTTGPGALQLQQYLSNGRFPEDNTALPKAPVPVISVFFPFSTFDEFKQNSLEFMQNMPNPEIGGFFTVVREGGGSRAGNIVDAVRTRFSKMHLVKWRVSCIAPSVTQTFGLVFNNVNPPILGDNTFKEVPVGIDPTTWPLDVNIQYSQDMAKRQDGVYAGGKFKLYGDFCWGGEKSRAEVYFLPSGQQIPVALSGADVEKAKRTQQQLIAMGMKGTAVEASDTFVEFEAPDKDKILHGSGDQAVVRLVVYDNKARRASGVTTDSIIQLKGASAPFPILYVLIGLFGVVAIAIVSVLLLRGGGRKRSRAPAPAGAPPYGYTPPPAYNPPPPPNFAPPPPQNFAPPPQQNFAPPPQNFGHAPAPAPAVNPEFMYGAGPQPQFGAPAAAPPPPNPYGAPIHASRATLQGAAGVFSVTPGIELRAGRDGSQCGILLAEPRVSGVHATLKLEGGQLFVRDENSNNGTQVNGNRITPGTFSPVPNGSLLRFGPVEFSVRLE